MFKMFIFARRLFLDFLLFLSVFLLSDLPCLLHMQIFPTFTNSLKKAHNLQHFRPQILKFKHLYSQNWNTFQIVSYNKSTNHIFDATLIKCRRLLGRSSSLRTVVWSFHTATHDLVQILPLSDIWKYRLQTTSS